MPTGERTHNLALREGTMLFEYRLEKMLGKGGFGLTYLAEDVNLARRVAIKELLPDGIAMRGEGTTVVAQTEDMEATFQWASERFLDEARTLARLTHPSIVKVIRYLKANGTVYMVMDFVEGQGLDQVVKSSGGALPEDQVRSILISLLHGVEYVHCQDILHRDIKPGNVLVTSEGTPVLIDFGSARENLGRTMAMTSVVSFGYSPWEQIMTNGKQGPWTDIYALSATAIYMMTGHAPKSAADRITEPEPEGWLVEQLGDRYSEPFLRGVEWGFRAQVKDRPQSVAQWQESLSQVPKAPLVPPPPTPSVEHRLAQVPDGGPEFVRRVSARLPSAKSLLSFGQRYTWVLLGVAGFCLLVGGLVAFWPTQSSPIPNQLSSPVANGVATGVSTDNAEAAGYRVKAMAGDADAATQLGLLYYNGQGVTQDYAEALKWFQKAAAQGNAEAQYNLGLMFYNGEGVNKDYGQALIWYQKAAAQGNAYAQNNLGVMYRSGQGVAQDYNQALIFYRKAADQGNASAQNNLGWMYQYGLGVTKDYHQALVWYQKGAVQGQADAQCNLGAMYYNGQGITQDYSQAATWYQKAAEQGDADAQNNLGYMYCSGLGVTQDYSQALSWYQKAADQGSAVGQDNVGEMYYAGQGVRKDYRQAAIWYRKGADQGYAPAQNDIGAMYRDGQGVPKDYNQALSWYQKAADQGNVDAQYNLGAMYYLGQGVGQDYSQALIWYQKAAAQGYADAQNDLGLMYESGQGVTQDYGQALSLYQKAAAQGNANAQNNLGVMYEGGQGVAADMPTAVAWYRKAASQGNTDAQNSLKRLGY